MFDFHRLSLGDFAACSNPSASRVFTYEELLKSGKLSLDLLAQDVSLENSANLPALDIFVLTLGSRRIGRGRLEVFDDFRRDYSYLIQ